MSQKQASRYCAHCEARTLATAQKPNHLLHFVLSLFTCGLWLFIWPLVVVGSIGGYRCVKCGTRV
jgi:hypothetical protein